MASSRNSTPPSKLASFVEATFRRALEAILARVVVSGTRRPPIRIAVAYSGGLDSSVLLHLMAAHARPHGVDLTALHVHHGLSPHAAHWLAHCRQQAEWLGAGFDAREVVLPPVADHGVEEAARLARYQALASMCEQHAVPLLLLAHHQDDQAETVLLQLLRGAGLRGLGGMAAWHDDHPLLGRGFSVARPLLACARADLAGYASEHGLAFIDDESNADIRYRRNAIRQRIAPVMDTHFPGFAATVSRSARHLQSAQRLLDELAMIDLAACAKDGALIVDRLRELSDERIDNLLRHWLGQRAPGPLPSEAQLAQLRTQVLSAAPDAQPQLALCGLRLQRQRGRLVAVQATDDAQPSPLQIAWDGQSELAIPGWQGRLCFEHDAREGLDPELLKAGPLQLRPRRGGERLKLAADRPSRTLKNLFQESGIPAQARPWLPLLYVGDQLVYAAGLGHDARAIQPRAGVRVHWLSALHHVK